MNRVRCIVLTCVCWLSLTCPSSGVLAADTAIEHGTGQEVPLDEVASTLEFLYNQLQSNHDALRTWVGTYSAVDRYYWERCPVDAVRSRGEVRERGCWSISSADVRFALDNEGDRIRTDFVQSEATKYVAELAATDVIGTAVKAREYRWVRTAEALIEFPASDYREQVESFPEVKGFGSGNMGRVIYVQDPRNAKQEQRFGRFVDPREFMGNGTHLYSRTCQLYASALRGERLPEEREHAAKNLRLYREADRTTTTYTMVIRYPNASTGEEHRQLRTVFSSAVGFQVVSFEKRELSTPYETRKYQYQERDGTYFPSLYNYEFFERSSDDATGWRLAKQRTFTLAESEVNVPIDEEMFAAEGMGLLYGDRLANSLTNELLAFDGSKFVPAQEFTYRPVVAQAEGQLPHADQLPIRIWLLVTNLVVIAAVALWVLMRRRIGRG